MNICKECIHCRPHRWWGNLWGLAGRTAMEFAKCSVIFYGQDRIAGSVGNAVSWDRQRRIRGRAEYAGGK